VPYIVVESCNQEFEALTQVNKFPFLKKQVALLTQQIRVHVQGMVLPFYTGPFETPI
jgi:hypothetical protein